MTLHIFTHRGLEPSKHDFYPESSYEAFADHLKRGFGIEFDPNFAKDEIIVMHDAGLQRITLGRDKRVFADVQVHELRRIRYGKMKKGRISTFDELLQGLEKSKAPLHALHLKGKYQSREYMHLLLSHLQNYPAVNSKMLIFDLKPESAAYLKACLPSVQLAPSVAHAHDIRRYNQVVGNTLLSVEEALKYKKIYDWVWLDEWDTLDEQGEKLFYTKENFAILKSVGYKIALVTPELHATSPGLYGGESHQHAKDKATLFKRIREIIKLQPDAICTDYPEEVKSLIRNIS